MADAHVDHAGRVTTLERALLHKGINIPEKRGEQEKREAAMPKRATQVKLSERAERVRADHQTHLDNENGAHLRNVDNGNGDHL